MKNKTNNCASCRKIQLLVVTQRIFFRQGFYAATVSDVTAEAGVSQGTVYHHFVNNAG